MNIWTVKVLGQTISDLGQLHTTMVTHFGHTDQSGKLTGLSLRGDELRIHFGVQPTEEDISSICTMFEVNEVTYEQE